MSGIDEGSLALGEAHVGVDHHSAQLAYSHLRLPAEEIAGFRRVALQHVHFGRSKVAGVEPDVVVPVKFEAAECLFEEFADAV